MRKTDGSPKGKALDGNRNSVMGSETIERRIDELERELAAAKQAAIETIAGLEAKIAAQDQAERAHRAAEEKFRNLFEGSITNAVKFSSRGDAVEIGVSRQEGSVRVGISDNGPGIPEQFRDRIFEKYSQADASDSRRVGGTGLGLSISKAIVEKHGGDIGIDKETAKGTTFFFTLPELHTREVEN